MKLTKEEMDKYYSDIWDTGDDIKTVYKLIKGEWVRFSLEDNETN